MNDYEVLLMLDPEATEDRHTEIVSRARELVEKDGGTWLSHDAWGRRRLAYEIDHKTDGVYHLLQFDAAPTTLNEIARVLKITDGVMRHLATRRVKGGGRTAPPPQPVIEAAPAQPEDVGAPIAAAPEAAASETSPDRETSTDVEASAVAETAPAPEGAAAEGSAAEEYAPPSESSEPEEGA